MKRPKSLQEAIHVYPGTVFLVSHEADFYEEIVKDEGVNLVLFLYYLFTH